MKFFFIFSVVFVMSISPAFSWGLHTEYNVHFLKTFKGKGYGETLLLEKAWVYDSSLGRTIERIQIRSDSGNVIAYSPTRVTAIPFCFGRRSCWVFLWKTVYPLPAIYKFNPDFNSGYMQKNPPMQYSRGAPAGQNFDVKINPLLGAVGLLFLLKERSWYFLVCIFLSIVLCLQVVRYTDLPEVHKVWIKRALMLIFGLTPLPIEPYMINSIIIVLFSWFVGLGVAGVPFVVSVFTIFVTFFLCAMRLARVKNRTIKKM